MFNGDDPIAGLLSRGRERDLSGSQAIHPVPLPRSTTPAEPTIPRLLTVSSILPPRERRRGLQLDENFGAIAGLLGAHDEVEVAKPDVEIYHDNIVSRPRQRCAQRCGRSRLADTPFAGCH